MLGSATAGPARRSRWGSQEAGCRSRGVEFAPDSPLEGAVTSELETASSRESRVRTCMPAGG